LDFETPAAEALKDDLGIAPRLADLAGEAPAPLPELREPTPEELPAFTTEPAEVGDLDFATAAETEPLPKDLFAPIDEGALDVPPLDLGKIGEEPIPEFDLGPVTEKLDLRVEPSQPRRRVRKAGSAADTTAEAPPPVAPAPARAPAPKLDLPVPSMPRLAPAKKKPTAPPQDELPKFTSPPPAPPPPPSARL